ncbi:WW domain-containing transcription regulator protein 1 [Bombina bombina]|uniref:WW domain-containing transcription regulator protein 1 n=1 Tax=Bombina bombina TaxID=8345 RepID=UPI00235A991A|nr:WW domain-containing transcription regulator protein 1 [Bombina bombina]
MNSSPGLPPPGQQVIHVTQDLDTDLEALFNSVMTPQPSSWRKKILPESFFKEPDSGSHSRQSSTDSGSNPPKLGIQHVRSYSSPASLQIGAGTGTAPSPSQQHAHLRQQSYDVTDELPLPPGWEMAFTHTGQRYFLNHLEKITTWQDPRKTQTMAHMNHHPVTTSTPMNQRSLALSQPNLVMNHQHQPQMSSSPAISQQNHPTQNHQAALINLPNALTSQQQQQQKLRLQRIQMERKRIWMRQEELLRQEAALCQQLPMESENMAPVQNTVSPPAMPQDMRSVTNNGSDPFLNGGPYHSREQSTDSGLGLGCYSIPTTPEDFLSNMEEMDTGEILGQPTLNLNQQTRFPDFLDSLPGTNVDLGTLESEDLIPSLNDVECVLNKTEPYLTWL